MLARLTQPSLLRMVQLGAFAAIAAAGVLAISNYMTSKGVRPMPMAAETDYGLYGERLISLVTLNENTDMADFWAKLADKVEASDHDDIKIRLKRLSGNVVRFERTNELGSHIAIHMAIYEKSTAQGRRIAIQPLLGWLVAEIGTGESELIVSANAAETVRALRAELPPLAKNLD